MDIEMLISQRESVEEKLKKLDAMKPSIRESVYNKIKNEYSEKLNEIEEKLSAEKSYLLREIEQLEADEAEMSKRADELSEELDELNVRYNLGEYAEDEFKQAVEHKTAELEDYKRIRDEKREKKIKIKEIAGENEESAIVNEEKTEEDESSFIPQIIVEENLLEAVVEPEAVGEIDLNAERSGEERSPMDNILQPDIVNESAFSLGEDLPKNEKFVTDNPLDMNGENIERMASLDASLDDIEKMFDASLGGGDADNQEQIEGLKCPKCGHMNKPDLFNCEKCGSELL